MYLQLSVRHLVVNQQWWLEGGVNADMFPWTSLDECCRYCRCPTSHPQIPFTGPGCSAWLLCMFAPETWHLEHSSESEPWASRALPQPNTHTHTHTHTCIRACMHTPMCTGAHMHTHSWDWPGAKYPPTHSLSLFLADDWLVPRASFCGVTYKFPAGSVVSFTLQSS